MAIKFTTECAYPNNLESAAFELRQELGDNVAAILNDVIATEAQIPELEAAIAEADAVLDEILAKADPNAALRTPEELAELYGLPRPDDSQTRQEALASYSGLVVHKGKYFVSGDKSEDPNDANNILVLRRLYFACGKSLERVTSFLAEGKNASFQNGLNFTVVPFNNNKRFNYLTELISTSKAPVYYDMWANIPAASASATNNPFAIYYTWSYLDKNALLAKYKDLVIRSASFFFGSPPADDITISRYSSSGYNGTEIAALIAGEDLRVSNDTAIDSLYQENQAAVTTVINELDFISTRSQLVGLDKVVAKLNTAIEKHKKIISQYDFEVTVILKSNTLDKLREKFSDSEIISLLEDRPDVVGLYFDAPDSLVESTLNSALNITAGSTTLSNRYITNRPSLDRSLYVEALTLLYAARDILLDSISREVKKLPDSLREFLISYSMSQVWRSVPSASGDPSSVQGSPSTSTPADTLSIASHTASLGYEARVNGVKEETAKLTNLFPVGIARPLEQSVNFIADLFEEAVIAIENIMGRMKDSLLLTKRKLDAFLSKLLLSIGSGSFGNSFLKCVVNINFQLPLNLIDKLISLLENLTSVATGFLGRLAGIFSNLADKLICGPNNLVNAFLGKVSSAFASNAPAACTLGLPTGFTVGEGLTKALAKLRTLGDLQTRSLSKMSLDLGRIDLVLSTSADRTTAFKGGALCGSQNTQNFVSATLKNIGL